MITLDLTALEAMQTITDQDRSLASRLIGLTPAFMSGSYLTNPETANDIDIVISETEYWDHESHFLGFRHYDKLDGDQYREVHELAWTSYAGRVNLLVVKDLFLPAYQRAAFEMTQYPHRFQTRKERIKLHQQLKNVIRSQHDMELREIED